VAEKRDVLVRHLGLGALSEKNLSGLIDFLTPQSYPADHVLLQSGQKLQTAKKRIIILRRGECRAVLPSGFELPRMTAGSVIGRASCLNDVAEAATVSAVTAIDVYVLPWQEVTRRLNASAMSVLKQHLRAELEWTIRTADASQRAVTSCSDKAIAAARAPVQPKLVRSPFWRNKPTALDSELAKSMQNQLDSMPTAESAMLYRDPMKRPHSEPRFRADTDIPVIAKPTMAHLQVSAIKRCGHLVRGPMLRKMEQRILRTSSSDFGLR
jgi:CRP-like cAMP-binding protein